MWTNARLQATFKKFNREYFCGMLQDWAVAFDEGCLGLYGYADPEKLRICIRLSEHSGDHDVKATLIHEMAHAATTEDDAHGDRWASEMHRLRAAGAPTNPLDFIPDYDKNRWLVTSFIEAAESGASWEEASSSLLEPDTSPELRNVCKHFFNLHPAERRPEYHCGGGSHRDDI
jgi:SprT-like family